MSKSTNVKTVHAPLAPKTAPVVDPIANLIGTVIENLPTEEIIANIPLYAKSTKVYATGIVPKEKTITEKIFADCVKLHVLGVFIGDKRIDKKTFMSMTSVKAVNASLSAGFYIWVRSGRPM